MIIRQASKIVKELQWWLYRIHPHVLRMDDMAMGIHKRNSLPVTAFQYRCRLCGHPFLFICSSGWEQLREGHPPSAVFRWREQRNETDQETGLLNEWAEIERDMS
jgi:hypothetical protein